MDERRQVLVNLMEDLRRKIQEIFDEQHNINFLRNLAGMDEDPLNCDEDGMLARILLGLKRSLAHEASLGYYPEEER